MKNNLFPIAKEGWNYLGLTLSLCIVSILLDFEVLSFIFFVVALFFAYVFRNPERELLTFEEKSVVSPVDGIVTAIEELEGEEYFYKVTIESEYKDVSILRVPLGATIECQSKYNGTRLNLNYSLAKKLNEHITLVFHADKASKIKVKHITKESFCGMKTDVIENKTLAQSLRYGVMINGITEVYLPENFRLNITLMDVVKASQSLLGYFSS